MIKTLLIGHTILIHLILPFILLRWIAFNKGDNLIYRLSVAIQVVLFIVIFPRVSAGWAWFSPYWSYLYIILLVPAVVFFIRDLKGLPWLPPSKLRPRFFTFLMFIFAGYSLFTMLEVPLFRDYEVGQGEKTKAINLAFPLKGKDYVIMHGGATFTLNSHAVVKSQKYALDILKVNSWGLRAKGLLPSDLKKYEVMGKSIFAPCDGEVIGVEDSLRDLTPPNADEKNIAGNYVLLFCQGSTILMAHLMKDSLIVEFGQKVRKGDFLAMVGNSGNTSEPHLHIHAVKGKVVDIESIASDATPVPMLFTDTKEKFLIRNDKVSK